MSDRKQCLGCKTKDPQRFVSSGAGRCFTCAAIHKAELATRKLRKERLDYYKEQAARPPTPEEIQAAEMMARILSWKPRDRRPYNGTLGSLCQMEDRHVYLSES